ncbi:hypothetical protein RU95_GL001491 [Enterococcus avium]|nr:hypothetical protein RU95_GL001491 [Enterococcus avium]
MHQLFQEKVYKTGLSEEHTDIVSDILTFTDILMEQIVQREVSREE